MDISIQDRETFLKIYIGQNIRKEGILQLEITEKQQIEDLLSKGLIKENHWYLDQFLTTEEGLLLGKKIVAEIITEKEKEIQNNLYYNIPQKALGFFINKYISKELDFPAEKPTWIISWPWSSSWKDSILFDNRIWSLHNKLFNILVDFGLCIKTHNYVSTRGGELRGLRYVISPEIQELLMRFSNPDFTLNQENTLNLYPVLLSSDIILKSDDIDYVRKQFYELLITHSVKENQIAGIIKDTSEKKLTSEYRGLFSEDKPFDIIDSTRFKFFLDNKLIEPAVNILLKNEGEIKEYITIEERPSLSEVKNDLGIVDEKELGEFYNKVSIFERQLREFIKEKLDDGWLKRIEGDIPQVANNWKEKKKKDKRWGIEPEKDLINYADLGDYIEIIKKYRRIFSDGDKGEIITHLKIWYNHGRNPIMHARTVDKQKYYTTIAAIQYLNEWMSRKR